MPPSARRPGERHGRQVSAIRARQRAPEARQGRRVRRGRRDPGPGRLGAAGREGRGQGEREGGRRTRRRGRPRVRPGEPHCRQDRLLGRPRRRRHRGRGVPRGRRPGGPEGRVCRRGRPLRGADRRGRAGPGPARWRAGDSPADRVGGRAVERLRDSPREPANTDAALRRGRLHPRPRDRLVARRVRGRLRQVPAGRHLARRGHRAAPGLAVGAAVRRRRAGPLDLRGAAARIPGQAVHPPEAGAHRESRLLSTRGSRTTSPTPGGSWTPSPRPRAAAARP